jgi:hypothetical protein
VYGGVVGCCAKRSHAPGSMLCCAFAVHRRRAGTSLPHRACSMCATGNVRAALRAPRRTRDSTLQFHRSVLGAPPCRGRSSSRAAQLASVLPQRHRLQPRSQLHVPSLQLRGRRSQCGCWHAAWFAIAGLLMCRRPHALSILGRMQALLLARVRVCVCGGGVRRMA